MQVAQLKYDLNALYSPGGPGVSGTRRARHPHRVDATASYVFVGDEVYAAQRRDTGLQDGNDLTCGRLQVDRRLATSRSRRIVAWYEPTDGGVHNVWVEGDTLYMGNYQGGGAGAGYLRRVEGRPAAAGPRDVSWILHGRFLGLPSPFDLHLGRGGEERQHLRATDINTGLWILKVEPKQETLTP